MKHILFILTLLCLPTSVKAQTESTQVLSFLQKAMNFNKTVPQEKVYMHFDNTGYFENETIWFKAYVTCPSLLSAEGESNQTKCLSKVLYVELLNPSGDVVKTTKWPIDSLGQANGDLKLDTLLGSGFYEVRAYTRYMTNWGVNACFSRVFPIFSAPKATGYYKDLSIKTTLHQHRNPNNRDRTDSLYTKAAEEGVYSNTDLMKTISVQFYPEGGDLVKGNDCRVAILAVDDNGRPYQGTGTVKNAQGNVLATVTTDTLGRGLFSITPDGGKLTMDMKNLKSKDQTFELPATKPEGCTLKLDVIEEQPLVSIQSTNNVCGRLLGYVIMNNGNIIHCDTVRSVPLIEIELDRERLAEGVNQFTLFDSNGRIMAERLFFICPKKDASDIVKISSPNAMLKSCGSTEVDIQALPNSNLSFTAIDPASMTNGKQGSIKTWMLLSSEIRGYVNNVNYYFEADDEAHRKSADLLMMTQGWRRYDWNLMIGQKGFEKSQPIEDKFYVYGKLNEYRKWNKVGNVTLKAFLYNTRGESLSGETKTDENGNYAFALPFMDGEWIMQMNTSVNEKQKTYFVGIDRQFSPVPRYISPKEVAITVPLEANIFVNKSKEPVKIEEEYIPIEDKNHLLKNVTVKGRRYFTNDDWRYKNESYGSQYATLFYDIDKELDKWRDQGKEDPSLFELMVSLNSMFGNVNYKDLPMPPADEDSLWKGRLSYGGRPIKWIVNNGDTQDVIGLTDKSEENGTKLYKAVTRVLGKKPSLNELVRGDMYDAVTSEAGAAGDEFFPVWPEEIRKAYIVPNSPYEEDQAVRIYLYTHKKFTTASNKGIRRTYFQGFNTPSTFEMEDYSVLPPMDDFRRTIFWEPNVKTDANGKAKVKFYNNSTAKEMYINVEGMSTDGHFMSNE